MISKKNFKRLINAYISQKKKDEKMHESFEKLFPESNIYFNDINEVHDAVISYIASEFPEPSIIFFGICVYTVADALYEWIGEQKCTYSLSESPTKTYTIFKIDDFYDLLCGNVLQKDRKR